MNYDLLWSKILEIIKTEVTALIYKTWFSTIKIYKIEGNNLTLSVPTRIHKDNIEMRYLNIIVEATLKCTNTVYNIDFQIEDEITNEPAQLSFNNMVNNFSNQEKVTYKHSSNLIKHYTFDTFVVGNSNKLAHAAAVTVAETPGETYNPLFFYGTSGLGKTHLMHAIGNYIEEHSNKKVLYVSSDQFTDDFSKINRKDDNNQNNYNYAEYFKNKYRSVDVLIIDDIQFLASKTKTQDEFFHTFNILHQDNKQIIISSDRSPNDLKQLEERLKTRFCWGLTVDISPPDFELRKNILKKKIEAQNLVYKIPEDVIEYIASNMTSDVRNLEGAINRLMVYSLMMGYNEITLPHAVDALKEMINKGTSEKADILKVQKVVADHYQISVDDLKGKKRTANIAFARQIAMYLCRNELNESFERIGLEFGGKDHSTVIHSCDKIEKEINNKEETRKLIEIIKENIL